MGHKPMGSGLALSEQEQQCLEAIRAILSEHGAIPAFQSGLHKYLNAAKVGSQGRSQCYLGKLSDLVVMSVEELRTHIEGKLAKRGCLSTEWKEVADELPPGDDHESIEQHIQELAEREERQDYE